MAKNENVPNESTVNMDALLEQAGQSIVSAAPPAPASETKGMKTETPEGGAFMGSDGRMLYRYKLNDETIVLPKPIEQMTEEDFYQLPITMVDPAAGRLPQTLTVKFRDPHWAGHWFNRKAQSGRRVSEAQGLGFVPAKREDCEWVSHSLQDEDGAIIDNDLVLFKIHKAKLFLQYKQWMDTAKMLGGKGAYKQTAEAVVGGRGGDKVGYYFTPQAEREFAGVGPVTHIPTVS